MQYSLGAFILKTYNSALTSQSVNLLYLVTIRIHIAIRVSSRIFVLGEEARREPGGGGGGGGEWPGVTV